MPLLQDVPKRWFNIGAFALCAALLGYAYYLQFHDNLDPCPLCIFQRIALISMGTVFLAAGVHDAENKGSRIYAGLIALVALIGAGIAGRHAWLQHFPPAQIPECGGGLEYMLEILPLTETLKIVFSGAGECTEITWTFLGLSMPTWVLLWFIGLGVIGFVKNWLAFAKG